MSANTFTKSTKYTVKELESYVADPNACVQKLEWTDLISVLPKYLGNICEGVKVCLSQKIGTYDRKVDGIILAFKNTKILSPLSAIRPNSVRLHIKIRTDFYVFRPFSGAAIEGTVHYVSTNYLSAVIYRVFNVTIKLQTQKLQNIARGSDISFIVKSFDMKSDLPYIEGELIKFKESANESQLNGGSSVKKEKAKADKKITIKREKSDSDTPKETEAKRDEPDGDESFAVKCKKEPKTKEKTRKRKHSKTNGKDSSRANNVSSDDEMEYSINAILSGLEKDLNDTTDSVEPAVSVKKEPVDQDSCSSAGNSTSASKKKKKKKKSDDIDLLQAELLQKIAAQYSEVDSAEQNNVETTSVKVEPAEPSNINGEQSKKRKKKKKSKTHDEDDFEASIMSSILKCAAEVDEDDIKVPPPGSSKKVSSSKTPRKSVRFDETITEASFNAFDASELLEISQLHAPALSSTLKDIDHHK